MKGGANIYDLCGVLRSAFIGFRWLVKVINVSRLHADVLRRGLHAMDV